MKTGTNMYLIYLSIQQDQTAPKIINPVLIGFNSNHFILAHLILRSAKAQNTHTLLLLEANCATAKRMGFF
jgi:hypothetical protein